MKFRPLSGTISAAEGRVYLGQSGSTFLLLLNSTALGLAPSMSPTNSGLEVLLMCLLRSGIGSTKVERAKLEEVALLGMRTLGAVPAISCNWKEDSR